MEMLHIRLPKGTHKELKLYAVANGKSMTSVIGDILLKFLKEKKEAV